MKTYYVYDSSAYYVSKLLSNFSVNKKINLCFVSTDPKIEQKEIIYIVNDLSDFVDYLVMREKHIQTHLVVTSVYLIRKLSLTKTFTFYTYEELEKYLEKTIC